MFLRLVPAAENDVCCKSPNHHTKFIFIGKYLRTCSKNYDVTNKVMAANKFIKPTGKAALLKPVTEF